MFILDLNAVVKVESVDLVSDVIERASLDLVVHALLSAMLAGECPAVSILGFVSITIRHHGNFSHVEEVRSCEGFSK